MTPICKHTLFFCRRKSTRKKTEIPPTHPVPSVPDFLQGLRGHLNAFSKKHRVHSRPHLWHGWVQEQVRHLQGRRARQSVGKQQMKLAWFIMCCGWQLRASTELCLWRVLWKSLQMTASLAMRGDIGSIRSSFVPYKLSSLCLRPQHHSAPLAVPVLSVL